MRILYIPKPKSLFYPVKYGLLYNWYAYRDARKITSSDDWRVSQYAYDVFNWNSYMGGFPVAGGKLKETGTTYWNTDSGTSNIYGFNFRGGGNRSNTGGTFNSIKDQGNFWLNSTGVDFAYITGSGNTFATGNSGSTNKWFGFSIRLCKTATGISDGVIGTYTGNNGKIYRTIVINQIEWLADNLAETKYRNGDWVHGYEDGTYTPISNANWAALTTEGVCCYNDDESNI